MHPGHEIIDQVEKHTIKIQPGADVMKTILRRSSRLDLVDDVD